MTLKTLTYRLLMALAALVLLAGCADDLAPEGPVAPFDESGVWVSVKIPSPAETRGPAAGEWGDGSEDARMNENIIRDLNIYFLRDAVSASDSEGSVEGAPLPASGSGLDADASLPLLCHKYIPEKVFLNDPKLFDEYKMLKDSIDNSYTCMYRLNEDELPQDNDFIIVIANWGSDMGDEMTLGTLRDKTVDHSWRQPGNANTSDWFVMSNAYNNQHGTLVNRVRVTGSDTSSGKIYDGTYQHPYGALVYLRRTAARIDLLYNIGNLKSANSHFTTTSQDYLIYKTLTESDEAIEGEDAIEYEDAYVELTDIIPLNIRQKGSYIFKRTTKSLDDKTISHAGVETVKGSLAANYVIDPKTISTFANPDDAKKEKELEDRYDSTRATVWDGTSPASQGSVGSILGINFASHEGANNLASIITYAEENTFLQDQKNLGSFATGLLLRAVYHPKTVYTYDKDTKTLSEKAHDGEYYTGDFCRYTANLPQEQSADADAGTGTAFSMKMRQAAPQEPKSIYFATPADAQAYMADNPTEAGYIETYTGGVCYYNVWIRHTDIAGDSYSHPLPMEFAIVRNNLYRLAFNFTGPGTPKVEIREPYNVRPHIFVRPWNVRTHPDILL